MSEPVNQSPGSMINASEISSRVLVSIVTFNSGHGVLKTVHSLLQQQGFSVDANLKITVFDNNSSAEYQDWLRSNLPGVVEFVQSPSNLGFSGGHNVQAASAVTDSFDYLLVVNPDVALEPTCLAELVRSAHRRSGNFGAFVPLLLRADQELQPLKPLQIDSCGIRFNSELRHFDRSATEPLSEVDLKEEEVVGGTGACLLLSCSFIRDVSFRGTADLDGLLEIYPQLRSGLEQRLQLFDEAFFAYREDAELALRSQRLGWRALFIPSAHAYHVRRVTPEMRKQLPPEINLLGVRNRFLLQLLHYRPFHFPLSSLRGSVIRNLVVLCGVFIIERSSARGVIQAFRLRSRCFERNRMMNERGGNLKRIVRWFHN